MKITLLANRDMASNFALNLLLPALAGHEVGLFLSARVGGGGPKPDQLTALQTFEQNLLHELASAGHSGLPAAGRFRSFAQLDALLQQPSETLNQINSAQGVAKIQQQAPDLIISIRYGVRLKDQIIGLPKFGVLNLHSSLLPHYRGVMATFWAMLNDEKTIGTTLHYISDSRLDEGDIVASAELPVDPHKSYLWHVLQLYIGGCQNIINAVTTLAKGEAIKALPQPEGGQYFTFPTAEDLAQFNRKGLVLVDEGEINGFIQRYY